MAPRKRKNPKPRAHKHSKASKSPSSPAQTQSKPRKAKSYTKIIIIKTEGKKPKPVNEFHPFMRLPRELRDDIYYLAMDDPKPRSLVNLRSPTLALVSKQVRAECLPVFFSKLTFKAEVHSNYQDMRVRGGPEPRTVSPATEQRMRMTTRCKTMFTDVPRWIKEWSGGRNVHFANVQIMVIGVEDQLSIGQKFYMILRCRKGGLSIKHGEPEHIWEQQAGMDPENDEKIAKGFAIMMKNIKAVSRRIPRRRYEFTGLTYRDLHEIAQEFCYVPECLSDQVPTISDEERIPRCIHLPWSSAAQTIGRRLLFQTLAR